jgi:hypothetical protein
LKRLLSSFKDTHQVKNNEEREKGKGEEPKATCERNKKEKEKSKKGAVCFSGAKVWADHKKKTFRPCTTQKI